MTAPSGWTGTEVSVRLRRGVGGTVRVDGMLCSAPVWFRWDGVTLWLVGSGASPMGDDRIRVRVDVGSGVSVTLRSVAATLVYAANGVGTRWDTDIHVAEDARLDWRPEPVILTERSRHRTRTAVHAAAGADVTVDEALVLGRAGERPGTLHSTLSVTVDADPVLLTSIDTSLPGWAGPAGIDGRSVVAQRLRLGDTDAPSVARPGNERDRCDATVLQPAPGCRLAVAVGVDVTQARRHLDAVLPG